VDQVERRNPQTSRRFYPRNDALSCRCHLMHRHPFFQLPYDVRSIILFMALGGRTFHVDIVHYEGTWQWRGGVCIRNYTRNGPAKPPSMRYGWRGPWGCSCLEEKIGRTGTISNARSIDIMGFLLSCKQAYTEGIDPPIVSTSRLNAYSLTSPTLSHTTGSHRLLPWR
jgi:hypothetical protein